MLHHRLLTTTGDRKSLPLGHRTAQLTLHVIEFELLNTRNPSYRNFSTSVSTDIFSVGNIHTSSNTSSLHYVCYLHSSQAAFSFVHNGRKSQIPARHRILKPPPPTLRMRTRLMHFKCSCIIISGARIQVMHTPRLFQDSSFDTPQSASP